MPENAPSSRRQLGHTSLYASALGLGGAPIGGRFGLVDEAQVCQLIEQFFHEGLTILDTAAAYSDGAAETVIGRCLASFRRDSYIITTKIKPPPPEQERRADAVRHAIDRSRARLACDVIDVLLLHDPYGLSHRELAQDLSAMARVRDSGEVSAIGVGIGDVCVLQHVVESLDVDCILLSSGYTLLNQHAGAELLPLCLDRRVGVILGSVFESGILATGSIPGARYDYSHDISADVLRRVSGLEAVCAMFAVPLPAAALQFAMAHPAISSVLVGTTLASHLREDCRLAMTDIPAGFWSAVVTAGLIDSSALAPRLGLSDAR